MDALLEIVLTWTPIMRSEKMDGDEVGRRLKVKKRSFILLGIILPYSEPEQEPSYYWYYCQNPQGYYP